MLISKILLIAGPVALVIYLVISSVQKRRRTLAEANRLLKSLRGENDQLQAVDPETRVRLLFIACKKGSITLEKLGTSLGELNVLCEKIKDKKFFLTIGKMIRR